MFAYLAFAYSCITGKNKALLSERLQETKKKETTEKQRNFQMAICAVVTFSSPFTPTTFVAAKRCSFCRAQVEVLKIASAIRERLQRGS